MKVAVFGANGATGRRIVAALISAGHVVVAAVRRPDAFSAKNSSSSVVVRVYDFSNVASVVNVISGCDAIVSAVGPRSSTPFSSPTPITSASLPLPVSPVSTTNSSPSSRTSSSSSASSSSSSSATTPNTTNETTSKSDNESKLPTSFPTFPNIKNRTLYSSSVRSLRYAMRATGVRRLLVLSCDGVEDDAESVRFMSNLRRRLGMNRYLDLARMETILEETSDIDWTVLRLTTLVDVRSRPYIVENRILDKGSFKISYADAADFIVKELENQQWLHKFPVIGYPWSSF